MKDHCTRCDSRKLGPTTDPQYLYCYSCFAEFYAAVPMEVNLKPWHKGARLPERIKG